MVAAVLGLALLVALLVRRRGGDAAQLAALQQSLDALRQTLTTLDERTRPLPESYRSLTMLQERTARVPQVHEKLTAIEGKMPVLDQVRTRVDEIRGYFASERGRGKVGEQAVEEILAGLPDDAWKKQVTLPGGKVDFAAVMPNGALLPIDAKTSGVEDAQRAEAAARDLAALPADAPPHERRRLQDEHERAVKALRTRVVAQAGRIAAYADARGNVVPVVVQAVPDPVFDLLDADTRRDCSEQNVEVVPYSLLPPFVSALRRQNTHTREDVERVARNLAGARTLLGELDDLLVNRLDRSVKVLDNAVVELKEKVRALDALLRGAEVQQTLLRP